MEKQLDDRVHSTEWKWRHLHDKVGLIFNCVSLFFYEFTSFYNLGLQNSRYEPQACFFLLCVLPDLLFL